MTTTEAPLGSWQVQFGSTYHNLSHPTISIHILPLTSLGSRTAHLADSQLGGPKSNLRQAERHIVE